MKKIKLKIFSIIMLLLVAICFSACGSINVMTIVNDKGNVIQLVSVSLDEQAAMQAGYDLLELKNDIYLTGQREVENILNNLKANLTVRLHNSRNEDEQLKITSALLSEYFDIYKGEWKDNVFSIGLQFYDMDIYKTVYNIDDSTTQEFKRNSYFLYDKVYITSTMLYYGSTEFYNKIFNEFNSKYPNLINEDSGQLLYTIETDLRREHSDANYVNKIGNKYYHTWVVEKDNLDKEITLYYNVANAGNCILICVGISLLTCLILILICKIINKKKKKQVE